jgi:peptidoglycan-N-acetylmuramic acid deacetylase
VSPLLPGALAAAVVSWLPATAVPQPATPPSCSKPIYLTLDTGNMRHAELIAGILQRRGVRATFFLANEDTGSGGALELRWEAYWQERVKEGHAFGSHTFDHVYFSAAAPGATAALRARPQFGEQAGRTSGWDRNDVCREIGRVDERFRQITGRSLARIWRAPGGRGPKVLFEMADSCGWQHVGWTPAGFLGDELPSDRHPNQELLARALASIRSGDILMAHLGIRSRKDPYAPTLDALIGGLQARGFCFATIPENPSFTASRP